MKRIFLIGALLLLFAFGFDFYVKTKAQILRVKTLDRFGQIWVALEKSLGDEPLEKYNPIKEIKKQFPSIVTRDGQILDGWGHPIKISIKKINKDFQVKFVSAGPDGVINTKDDIIQEEVMMEKGTNK